MPQRPRLALPVVLLIALSGCVTSRTLVDAPLRPGESELYAASGERVLDAALAAVDAAGLGIDEVLEEPGSVRTVLASRGWSWWDYGAIARVIVEPAGPDGGTWVRVTSRLKMGTNLAGKRDYREDIFGGIHGSLVASLGETLPEIALAPRVSDPLAVGAPLRVHGRRHLVTATDSAEITLADGLGSPPRRVTLQELDDLGEVERLIREPYHWERLFLASAVGVGVGLLFGDLGSSGGYGGIGWAYGVTFGLTGVALGAAWGNRGRTRWGAMP